MNIFKKNKFKWYYDIPSSTKFLSAKNGKKFELDLLTDYVDLLKDRNDEISIDISSNSKYLAHISIWGKDSLSCKLELVEPKKCSSFWLTGTKENIKILLEDIELLVASPSKFGLVLKEWE